MFRELARVVLLVEDQAEALAFYREALGFETLHDERVDGFRYLHIGLPGRHGMGIWLMAPMSDEERGLIGRQAGKQPFLVLYTDNLDEVRQRLAAQGVDAVSTGAFVLGVVVAKTGRALRSVVRSIFKRH